MPMSRVVRWIDMDKSLQWDMKQMTLIEEPSVGLSLERVRGSLDGVNNVTESFSKRNNCRQILVLNELLLLMPLLSSISRGLYSSFCLPVDHVSTAITAINNGVLRFSEIEKPAQKVETVTKGATRKQGVVSRGLVHRPLYLLRHVPDPNSTFRRLDSLW